MTEYKIQKIADATTLNYSNVTLTCQDCKTHIKDEAYTVKKPRQIIGDYPYCSDCIPKYRAATQL